MRPTFARVPVRPGRVFAALIVAAALFWGSVAEARQSQSVPDETTLARIVWTTLITLDNANRTGNYSVLREMGTEDFRRQHSDASLFGSFRPLREARIDVGRSILTSPTYYIPPYLMEDGNLRLRGGFETRPRSIRFDLVYGYEDGGWFLTGISVVVVDADAPR